MCVNLFFGGLVIIDNYMWFLVNFEEFCEFNEYLKDFFFLREIGVKSLLIFLFFFFKVNYVLLGKVKIFFVWIFFIIMWLKN